VSFGKILNKLGDHDFLLLDYKERFIKVSLISQGVRSEINIEAIYFSSFHIILDGFYHHVRSLALSGTQLGLVEWLNRFASISENVFYSLRGHYRNLGFIRDAGGLIVRLADILRLWMITGRVLDEIIRAVRLASLNRSDDLFTDLLDSMIITGVPTTVSVEYARLQNRGDSHDFQFFGL